MKITDIFPAATSRVAVSPNTTFSVHYVNGKWQMQVDNDQCELYDVFDVEMQRDVIIVSGMLLDILVQLGDTNLSICFGYGADNRRWYYELADADKLTFDELQAVYERCDSLVEVIGNVCFVD